MTNHDEWEELAAGHALGALEPEDEERFEAHLATCADCHGVLADTEAIMAELAVTTDQEAPPAELKARLMTAIQGESEDQAGMAAVSSPESLEGRRARKEANRWMQLAVAASVILLAVIAAGVWSLNRSSTTVQPQFVALESPSQQHLGTVELLGETAYVIPSSLPANDASTSQYVLWAVPDKGAPVAVGGFDVAAGNAAVDVGTVTADPASLKGFAVSKEPGRTVPSAPTVVVGQGAIT